MLWIDLGLDRIHNCIDILEHVMVPESENAVSLCLQVFCSLQIIFRLVQMLTAIDFDDQFSAGSTEVYNVMADGVLSTKLNTSNSMGTQA
jgi:hypothetical protein